MSAQHAPESQSHSGTACPVCSAGAERGQLICLECGSRITLAYRRPPSWKVPVAITALVLLLAVAGGVVAFQAIDDDAEREASAVPANPKESSSADRAGQGATTTTDGAAADPEGERSATDEAADADEEPRDAGVDDEERDPPQASSGDRPDADTGGLVRRGGLYTWPQSLRAFTVVLLSSEDRPSATSFARSAGSSPSNQVGVIRSDDFETLPPGFFVVFAGEYRSRGQADRAAARLGTRFPGAFAQLVRR